MGDEYIKSLLQILSEANGRGLEQKRVFCKLRGDIRSMRNISGVVDELSYVLTEETIHSALERGLIEVGRNICLGPTYRMINNINL